MGTCFGVGDPNFLFVQHTITKHGVGALGFRLAQNCAHDRVWYVVFPVGQSHAENSDGLGV